MPIVAALTALFLRQEGYDARARLQTKLARWPLRATLPLALGPRPARQATPAGMADTVLAAFHRLEHLAPPKLRYASWRFQWNSWPTRRRFQQDGPCLLCGKEHGDEIEHYAYCPQVRLWAGSRLRLPDSLTSLVGWLFLHPECRDEDTLIRVAVSIYATFLTVQQLRHSHQRRSPLYLQQFWNQCVTRGVRGHPRASAAVRRAWQQ